MTAIEGIANIDGDIVAWGGTGNSIALDADGNAMVFDPIMSILNDGLGDWTGAAIAVHRVTSDDPDLSPNDVFSFKLNLEFVDTGSSLMSGGDTFATYTNDYGVLSIVFTGGTTSLVQSVLRNILYGNDTPYGDATIRFSLGTGQIYSTADTIVTSNIITVDVAGDDGQGGAGGGFSLREALNRGALQATNDTIEIALPAGSDITLASPVVAGPDDTLRFGAVGGLTIGGGPITLGGLVTLDTGDGSSLAIESPLEGLGSVNKIGAGEVILSGDNSYEGITNITAGNLVVAHDHALGGTVNATYVSDGGTLYLEGGVSVAEDVVLSGSTLASRDGSNTLTGTLTLGAGNSSILADDGSTLTLGGVVSGISAANLNIGSSGTGTIVLSGANAFDNFVLVQGGTLVLAHSLALGGNANGIFDIQGNATVALQGGITVADYIGGISGSGVDNLGAIRNLSDNNILSGALSFDSSAHIGVDEGMLTLTGALSGAFDMTKVGEGTLVLATASNIMTGGITVLDGVLSVASDAALSAGTLTLDGGDLLITGSATIDNAITLAQDATIQVDIGATLSGSIGGIGELTKSGFGMLVLSNTNDFTGATKVVSGGLQVSGGNALADEAGLDLATGTSLILFNSETIGSLTGSGLVTLLPETTLTVGGDDTSGSFSGLISGPGGLTKIGSGTLTLDGDVILPIGTVTVSAGTLLVNGNVTTTVIVEAGATLGGSGQITGPVIIQSGGTLSAGVDGVDDGIGTLVINGLLTIAGGMDLDAVGDASVPGVDRDLVIAENVFGFASTSDLAVTGTGSANLMIGGSGNDAFSGLGGADVLEGGSGDDSLSGGGDADSLFGGEGNDLLDGGDGNDLIDGGDGNDTISYEGRGQVVISASFGIAQGSGLPVANAIVYEYDSQGNLVGIDQASQIERLIGSGGSEDLVDGASISQPQDTALGLVLDLKAGTLALNGTLGGVPVAETPLADYVLGIEGFEHATGTIYADSLSGDDGANTISGGDGDDTVAGGAGGDLLDGGLGEDRLSYAGSATGVSINLATNAAGGGDATGDTISGFEHVIGSAQDDTLVGTDGRNELVAGDGDDLIEGGEGDDWVRGGAGADTILGTAGGSDDIKAGDGIDLLDYAAVAANIEYGLHSVEGARFTAYIAKHDRDTGDLLGTDLAVGFEALKAPAGGSDTVSGQGFGQFDDLASAIAGVPVVVGAGLDVDLEAGKGGVRFENPDWALLGEELVLDVSGFEVFHGAEAADRILGGNFAGSVTIDGAGGADSLQGGTGDDLISGGEGNDVLEGGLGNDMLAGGTGSNRIDGGGGTDTADYSKSEQGVVVFLELGLAGTPEGGLQDTLISIEAVIGSEHGDTLIGSIGDDSLMGGAGNDLLVATPGADTMDGGDGFDVVAFAFGLSGDEGVVVSLDPSVPGEGATEGLVLQNIEGVIGTAGHDWLIGDVSGSNWAGFGMGSFGQGNLLVGKGGNDTLDGGMGSDTLFGGEGSNLLLGGEGHDTADFSDLSGPVQVRLDLGYAEHGEDRDDLLSIEAVVGTDGNDLLVGDDTDNVLSGGAGNDTLEGGAGSDELDGGDGRDMASHAHATRGVTAALTSAPTLTVGMMVAPSSPNTGDALGDYYVNIEDLEGSRFADALYGNEGDNLLRGLAGRDALYGGAGNDTLEGGEGGDAMNGGDGFDMASYERAATAVQASLAQRLNQLDGGLLDEARQDSYVSIEGLRGSVHADRLVGNGGDNLLQGLGGDDTLSGGAGNDTLEGGIGADSLVGGEGTDVASYVDSAEAVTIDLAAGTAAGGDAAGDVLEGVEDLLGSAHDDALTGDAEANRLSGGGGNDTLSGGAGADTLDGGDGTDTASYAGEADGILLDLDAPGAGTGVAAGDVLISIENIEGTSGNDTLRGDAGGNLLDGRDGDDLIEGRGGDDTLIGGTGVDTVTYAGAVSAMSIDLDAGQATSGSETDSLSGFENAIGGSGADTLTGSTAANLLDGGEGADVLSGGGGLDTLLGGLGGDSLSGEAGDDDLRGGAGNDTLRGGDGADTLDGGTGSNFLDGGDGADLVDYAASGAASVVFGTLGGELARYDGESDLVGTDTLVGIETLVATAGLEDLIDGSAETDRQVVLDLGSEALSLVGDETRTMAVRGFEDAEGGALDDLLTGSAGDNILAGNLGDDTLSGMDGDDHLLGGDGNDLLVGAAGADTLDGGAGTDTADYAAAAAGVTVDLVAGTAAGTATGDDVLIGVENVIGTDLADRLTGDANANVLEGGGGQDTLSGGAGADTLVGGAGDDVLLLASVADFATGEVLQGGEGVDVLRVTTASADTLVLTADVTGIEEVRLSDADGATNGMVAASIDATALAAGAAITLTGNEGANLLTGNDNGANLLVGNGGADTLIGGSEADTLVGGAGADRLEGGGGSDWADYAGSALAVSINLKDQVQALGDAEGDRLIDIENVVGTAGADFLRGNEADNVFVGGAGMDSLQGFEGNDTLEGNAGADELIGGTGIDLATYRSATAAVVVDLRSILVASGEAAGDTFLGIENLEGSAWNDVLHGDGQANLILGGEGQDTLEGDAGADTLDGGLGADSMSGGFGDDVYIVDNVGDVVNERSNRGTDTVQASVSFSISGQHIENLILTGSADINGTGSSLDNVLIGNAGSNVLNGGTGNDTLDGGDGADTLIGGGGADSMTGGFGDDVYVVDNVGDVVNERSNRGTDTVLTSVTYSISGQHVENLTLTGSADINGMGSSLNNLLTGNTGNNLLNGGSGNDTLIGGLGADTLTGGSGDDHYVWRSAAETTTAEAGRDVITGWATGDQLNLSAIDADTAVDGNQAFSFVGLTNTPTEIGAGEVSYYQADGRTYIIAGTNNGAAPDLMIQLNGLHTLTESDFIL